MCSCLFLCFFCFVSEIRFWPLSMSCVSVFAVPSVTLPVHVLLLSSRFQIQDLYAFEVSEKCRPHSPPSWRAMTWFCIWFDVFNDFNCFQYCKPFLILEIVLSSDYFPRTPSDPNLVHSSCLNDKHIHQTCKLWYKKYAETAFLFGVPTTTVRVPG